MMKLNMNAKKKGNAGENNFAHFLRNNGFGAARNSSSGGNVWKGDIHSFKLPMCFEVKTVKKLNLKEAWRQVDRDSGMSKQEPVLAVHFDGMPEGEWLMVMHSSDWIEYVKQAMAKPKVAMLMPDLKNSELARQLREIAEDLSPQ